MRLRWVIAALGTVLGTVTPARAAPAEQAICVRAANAVPTLRRAGQLRAARKEALICASDGCPAIVADECRALALTLATEIPSIVPAATDPAGADIADVRVTLDGVFASSRAAGADLDVDPGEHLVVFERPGVAPQNVKFVARLGEKRRLITARFESGPSAKADAAVTPRSGVGAWPFVFGGLSVASLAGAIALHVTTSRREDQLSRDCQPRCDPNDVDPLRVSYGLAIGLYGFAAASGALSFWFALSAPSHPSPGAVRVGLGPGNVWLSGAL